MPVVLLPDCYVVTPGNMKDYDAAAKGGNASARTVVSATMRWAHDIEDHGSDHRCFNPCCHNKLRPFDMNTFVPMALVVLMLSVKLEDALVQGLCAECAALPDFEQIVADAVKFMLDDIDMVSVAVH